MDSRQRLDRRLHKLDRRYRWRYSMLPILAVTVGVLLVLGAVFASAWMLT